jgi:hypothetical protein
MPWVQKAEEGSIPESTLIGHPCHPSSPASTPWVRWCGQREPSTKKRYLTSNIFVSNYRQTHLGLLLLCLLGLLLLLGLADGRRAGLQTIRSRLVAPCGDGSEVGADDTTLVLHGAARALLRDLLRDTLLVHPTVHLRPGDLAGVLALQEERLILAVCETEDLAFSCRK